MDKVDLLLVNPGTRKLYQDLSSSISAIEPPFWAGLIASYVRRQGGHSVLILDADAENLNPEETAEKVAEYNPLLTAVIAQGSAPATSSTPKMAVAGGFLKALKRRAPNLRTIIGGIHPSALPERTLREEEVNYVCQGEGFYTILQLIQYLSYRLKGKEPRPEFVKGIWWKTPDGGHIARSPRPELLPAKELPPVAWDLLDMSKYRAHNWLCLDHLDRRSPYAVIYTSLGCPFQCTFCNIQQMYLGTKPSIRYRDPEEVVKEIDLLVNNYGVRNIKVMDELFALKRDNVMKLCDLIIQRGYDLNMWAYGRVGLIDYEMLTKMKQAGINWICYGFESASAPVRKGVGKRFDQSKMLRAIEDTYMAGMHIQANFIFGLPDDSLNTMRETLEMAEAYNFEWCNFYCSCAYPGSKLYQEAIRQGVKLPETWADYSQYAEGFLPLPTKYLSAYDVLNFRDNAFSHYFTRPKYLEAIETKFGKGAVGHIKAMLEHKLKRVLYPVSGAQ